MVNLHSRWRPENLFYFPLSHAVSNQIQVFLGNAVIRGAWPSKHRDPHGNDHEPKGNHPQAVFHGITLSANSRPITSMENIVCPRKPSPN
jgi:hypothetical protein